uniref:La-related protein 6C n=1 Tax=Kalanchoe fedtschenkoi TaxID=63787 RepID=A0A7N0SZN6_KALFE
MAQASAPDLDDPHDAAAAAPPPPPAADVKAPSDSSCGTATSFKFNAQAPEFVPPSHTQQPVMPGYMNPYFQFLGGFNGNAANWFYVADQDPLQLISSSSVVFPHYSKNVLTEDLKQKIIRQVEYQLSDMSLLANDTLSKHMSKDPEGYVPMPVIANSKKIKALVTNNHLLVQALHASTKLVVSHDGKKVKRKHPFTERDKEELQARTVVVENLPDDHSHQNLEKILDVVGKVKTIRICHPPDSNSSRSKGDFLVSNKIHALVEYESPEIAEKAVQKLNDERNWRKGLRVRLLLRCSPKSVLKNRKSEFEGCLEDCEAPSSPEANPSLPNNIDFSVEGSAQPNSASRKGWGRGRSKAKTGTQSHIGQATCAQSVTPVHLDPSTCKPITKGPKMPDGTRGFTMGRGKPITS